MGQVADKLGGQVLFEELADALVILVRRHADRRRVLRAGNDPQPAGAGIASRRPKTRSTATWGSHWPWIINTGRRTRGRPAARSQTGSDAASRRSSGPSGPTVPTRSPARGTTSPTGNRSGENHPQRMDLDALGWIHPIDD